MVSRQKVKGDKAELAAVAALCELASDLVVTHPMRMLGAGRKDDVGDLRVFDDVVVQVRAYRISDLSVGLRTSALDAERQAVNAGVRLSLGLVPYPNARTPRVRWLATARAWPEDVDARLFGMAVSKAVTWARDDTGPARTERVAHISGRGAPDYYLAPLEAWVAAFRCVRTVKAAA